MATLKENADLVLNNAQALDEQGFREVLVPRPWFVEDSSRQWSAAMLCRHLAIVDGSVAKAMERGMVIRSEDLPPSSQRVAAVEPECQKNNAEAYQDMSLAVSALEAAARRRPEAELMRKTIPHPWLGELTHLQWIWFAAFHHKLHFWHLEKIAFRLKKIDAA